MTARYHFFSPLCAVFVTRYGRRIQNSTLIIEYQCVAFLARYMLRCPMESQPSPILPAFYANLDERNGISAEIRIGKLADRCSDEQLRFTLLLFYT